MKSLGWSGVGWSGWSGVEWSGSESNLSISSGSIWFSWSWGWNWGRAWQLDTAALKQNWVCVWQALTVPANFLETIIDACDISPGLISFKFSKALRFYFISSPVVSPKKCLLVFYFISNERKQGVSVSLSIVATQLSFTVCLPEISCINSMWLRTN